MAIRDHNGEIVQKPYPVPTRLPSIHELKAVIRALKPAKTKRGEIDSLITESYAEIQTAIGNGVTKKELLAKLAQNGLKMSPAKFKKLLDAEEQRRSTQSVTGGAK